MKDDNIYKIFYLDEKNNLKITQGKSLVLGIMELSWFDLEINETMYIHKDRFLMRYKTDEVQGDLK